MSEYLYFWRISGENVILPLIPAIVSCNWNKWINGKLTLVWWSLLLFMFLIVSHFLSCLGFTAILGSYQNILQFWARECEVNSKHFLASKVVIDCYKHLTFKVWLLTHVHRPGPILAPLHRCVVDLQAGLEPGHGKVHGYHHRLKEARWITYLWQSSGLETHLSFVVNITYFIDHKLELIIPRQWFVLQVVIWNMSRITMLPPTTLLTSVLARHIHISFVRYLLFRCDSLRQHLYIWSQESWHCSWGT